MILSQDVIHLIGPLEYFEADRKNAPIAVRTQLIWVLSGPLPSTPGLFSTCFKAVARSGSAYEYIRSVCYGRMTKVAFPITVSPL